MFCSSCLQTCYKSKFITAELARLFSQSDDEEEFEGFGDEEEEEQDEPLGRPSQEQVGGVGHHVFHVVNRNGLTSSITVCVCLSVISRL